MKKIYHKPEIRVVTIEQAEIVCTSSTKLRLSSAGDGDSDADYDYEAL